MGRWTALLVLIAVVVTGCTQEEENSRTVHKPSRDKNPPAAAITAIQASTPPRDVSAVNPPSIQRSLASSANSAASKPRPTGPVVQVSGRVSFDDGTPLMDRLSTVSVELYGPLTNGSPGETLLDSVTVDEQGRYTVTGADGENRSVKVVGVSNVIADIPAPDDNTTATRVRRHTQDFIIPITHIVTGHVLDGNNRPISSATISLRSDDVITDGWYYGNQFTTSTTTGEFVLPGVAAGSAIIGAVADGYGPITQPLSVPTSGPVTLRLTTGSTTLRGHVVLFPNDVPLAGARVRISPGGEAQTLGLVTTSTAEAYTNHNGSFDLDGLSAGQYTVSVHNAEGNEMFRAPGRENAAAMTPVLLDHQTTAATIRVFGGYTISGLVYDKDTSEPLAGVDVTLNRTSTPIMTSTTEADGEFRLEGINPDSNPFLTFTAEDFMVPEDAGLTFKSGKMVLSPSLPEDTDHLRQDVPMVAVITVSGRVENTDGDPVPGAEVKWNSASHMMQYMGDFTAQTDRDGQFSMRLLPFQEGKFEVTAPGYAFMRSEPVRLASLDRDDIVIVLEAGASVTGQVVNPGGEGVADATISINDHYSIGGSFRMGRRQLATSLTDGSFAINNLPSNTPIVLIAEAKSYASGSETVKMVPGEARSGIVIRLNEELTIEGRVVNLDDNPVQASIMELGSSSSTRTDGNGEFKIGGLSEGESHLFISPQGYTAKQMQVQAGTKDLVIRVGEEEKNYRTAYCTVVDSITKEIIEDFDVKNAGTVKREGPGRFSFKFSGGGSYLPKISAKGYVTRIFRVSEPNDSTGDFEVTLEMGTGSGVTGRVVNVDGDPLSGIPVAGYDAGAFEQAPAGNTITSEDGTFLIAGLPAGEVRVSAIPSPPASRITKRATLKDGEFENLGDFTIGQSGTIRGRIQTSSGDPLAGKMVNLNANIDGDSYNQMVTTDNDGRFAVENLQPGTYHIHAEGQGKVAEVRHGETTEVIIEVGQVTLTGRVTRGGENAKVFIRARHTENGNTHSFSVSRERGTYTIRGMAPGTYQVTFTPYFSAGEAVPENMEALQDHSQTITITGAPEQTQDFTLP